MSVVGRVSVMTAWAPGLVVGTKVMVIGATKGKGSGISAPWRIETPAEWAIEDSVAGDKGERIEPGIPIPAVSEPTKAARHVSLTGIRIGFRKVGGAQAGPAIEIFRLGCLLVELLGFELVAAKVNFTAALDFNAALAIFDNSL